MGANAKGQEWARGEGLECPQDGGGLGVQPGPMKFPQNGGKVAGCDLFFFKFCSCHCMCMCVKFRIIERIFLELNKNK